jgi:exopolysaccharide production protein ExoZ
LLPATALENLQVQKKNNLNLIQVLRGIASLLVVLFHTTINVNSNLKKEFCFNSFTFGGAGVDIFFVLSGFIITYSSLNALKTSNNPFSFLRRRFVRIFPAYWVVITLFIIVQLFFSSFYNSSLNDFEILNIAATYFLLPGHRMINGVSWTLTYELFFYLLFSIAFIIPNKKAALLLGILYAIVITVLPVLQYNFTNSNTWIQLIIFPMNTEFFMGILAALIVPKIPQKISPSLIIAGSLFFLGGAVLYNKGYNVVSNGFNRVLLFGIPSFFIITGIVKYELTHKINVHNFLLKLGEASYSLYLLHLPLVVAAIKIIGKLGLQNAVIIHCLLIFIVAAICCFSILFFNCIEKPVISKLNSFGRRVFS